MSVELFAKRLAHEIITAQHKVLDGRWSSVDLATIIEIRTQHLINQIKEQE